MRNCAGRAQHTASDSRAGGLRWIETRGASISWDAQSERREDGARVCTRAVDPARHGGPLTGGGGRHPLTGTGTHTGVGNEPQRRGYGTGTHSHLAVDDATEQGRLFFRVVRELSVQRGDVALALKPPARAAPGTRDFRRQRRAARDRRRR